MEQMNVEGFWFDRSSDGKAWSIRLQSPEGAEFRLRLPMQTLPRFREAIDALYLKVQQAGHLPPPPSGSGRA